METSDPSFLPSWGANETTTHVLYSHAGVIRMPLRTPARKSPLSGQQDNQHQLTRPHARVIYPLHLRQPPQARKRDPQRSMPAASPTRAKIIYNTRIFAVPETEYTKEKKETQRTQSAHAALLKLNPVDERARPLSGRANEPEGTPPESSRPRGTPPSRNFPEGSRDCREPAGTRAGTASKP